MVPTHRCRRGSRNGVLCHTPVHCLCYCSSTFFKCVQTELILTFSRSFTLRSRPLLSGLQLILLHGLLLIYFELPQGWVCRHRNPLFLTSGTSACSISYSTRSVVDISLQTKSPKRRTSARHINALRHGNIHAYALFIGQEEAGLSGGRS